MSSAEHDNVCDSICRRHKDAVTRIALKEIKPAGINTYTFRAIDFLSDKFANLLVKNGVKQGDSILVALPLSVGFIIANFGGLKAGAIINLICNISDSSSLLPAIQSSQAKIAVLDFSLSQLISNFGNWYCNYQAVFVVSDKVSQNEFENGFKGFWFGINQTDAEFTRVNSLIDSPAYRLHVQDAMATLQCQEITHGHLLACVQKSIGPKVDRVKWENWSRSRWSLNLERLEAVFQRLYIGDAIDID